MTQHREAGEPMRWRKRMKFTGSRYRVFSACVLAVGAGFAAFALAISGQLHFDTNLVLPFALLTIGFVVTEMVTTDINVRRVDWTISFNEIPIVIGLLAAPFPVVLAAHLLAGIALQLRRGALSHIGYNGGVMCLEIAVPFAIIHYSAATGLSMPLWFVAMVAVLIGSLVSTGCGLAALQTLGADLRIGAVLALAGRTLVLGVVNTVLGIVGYQAAIYATWGWLMTLLLSASVGAMAWGYSRQLREQRDLGTLAEISLNVARYRADATPGGDTEERSLAQWEVVAEQIRDQLGADRVLLHLLTDECSEVRTIIAGRPLPDGALPEGFWRRDPLLQLPGNEVRYLQVGQLDEVSTALRHRGAHEALVVPLRNSARLLGAVEAHDKVSRWRGFGRTDMRLLRTVANHLSTATDNQRLVAKLRHDAYHDPQTGLLNRPGFLAAAAELAAEHRCVVMLRVDLDVLSTVSDALGYAWGDRMVVSAGQRLREELGPDTPLARLEGGAFAVLLCDPEGEDCAQVAGRLREVLSAPYEVGRLTVEANTFVGYAQVRDTREEECDVDVLLQHADVALRTARGGDVIREYSPSMGGIFLRRFQLVTQFRQAVERGEVRAFYQPKIALATKQLLGVEALVRWQHPEFGELSPDEFVPAVEATGLIDVLTSFITDQALSKIRAWLDDGVRMTVSVNLSVRCLDDDTFPDKVAAALATHGVPAELLTFEITESGVMADPERALPVLRRLHALGVVLALDDFGTGYSSLAYLRQLPVDEVKIDKSFVLGMGTDLGDLAVVRSIVELGHSLGLVVVAEGVEDDAAREALLDMSCDIAQGYLISRPLPEERLAQWLQARTLRDPAGEDVSILTLMS